MDTNLVLPLTGSSVDRCRVVFDYWLDTDALHAAAATTTQTALQHSGASGSSSSGSSSDGSRGGTESLSAGTIQAALQSQFVQDSLASSHQVQVGGCCVVPPRNGGKAAQLLIECGSSAAWLVCPTCCLSALARRLACVHAAPLPALTQCLLPADVMCVRMCLFSDTHTPLHPYTPHICVCVHRSRTLLCVRQFS